MGTSTNAILAYGYDLGSDDEWKLEGSGEYGEYDFNTHDWYSEDEDGYTDFVESVEAKLLAAHGFTETDWQVDGFYRRQKEAKAAMGVEVVTHCSGESPMYVLAVKEITAYRGDCKVLDFDSLNREATEGGYDEKLRAALSALGLTPKQDRAQWLLCSYWG
ncbi:hypothetical protein MED01_002464 [Micromonospora sp. MED01]|uniref:hypothetical protein n=1 Tax=Micromonospora alfalfae TaxID=2911212 RepID=UPI001EE99474|nr:hypothetical protein [Micromonospora alfalfae]MCG5464298.1 hypothetical protein [Micromonospora alfalfae]